MPASRSLSVPVVMALSLAAPAPLLAEAQGVADPVVSFGLSELADWSSAPVFLDLARSMRPFFAYGNGWETQGHDALREGGFLDEDGYPVAIPDGSSGIRTGWDHDARFGGALRAGRYVFTYSGTATITLAGDAVTVETAPGRIVYDNPEGGPVWIEITAIDPDDHPRDFSVLREDRVALARAGAMFDPDWLAIVADARELRFMDWLRGNAAGPVSWDDRPKLTDATWSGRGIPVEVMIRLANEAGIDPWFTVPATADPAYIRAFALLVRDGLDPRLKVHAEYSNETWNAAFPQFAWLRDQAVRDWGDGVADDWEAIFAYHVKRATEAALVWQAVFGADASARLVNILGTQAGNAWLTGLQMFATEWQRREPDSFIPPTEVFEEVAATTYFGGGIMVDPDLRAELQSRAAESGDDANRWLAGLLQDADAGVDSVPAVLALLGEQQAVVHAAGLRFVAYEGGQHVHHSFAIDDLPDAEADALASTMADFVRSPEMADLYARLWDGWRDIGDGPFMQFVEMSVPNRWGSWGLLAFAGDRTPRADFLLARQSAGGSWWGEGGGAQYLQGRTAQGTAIADAMDGTDEEDFLAGLGGDDTFPESGGRDGINGGDGTDIYILSAPADAYAIAPEGAGYRVTGPRGSAWLTEVETLRFADGETVTLATR